MGVFSENAIIGASAAGGYDIDQSLLIYGNGSHLTRSPSSSGSLTTWTMSMWVKPDMVPKGAETVSNSPDLTIWSASDADTGGGWTDYFQIKALDATEFAIKWSIAKSGAREGYLETTRKFRDPSAWYHFVCVWDTGNSTSGDRMRLYVNGIRETAFSSETVPTLNGTTLYTNVGSQDQMIGNYSYYNIPYYSGGQSPANSYIAEVNFIDGQALTPASFGETNSATNQWVPVKYSGSYGTNGYYEKFSATELANSFTDDSGGYLVPSGVTSVEVLVVGGGGAGSGGGNGGGGGGAGGLVYISNYAVTPGERISVTVGAGGAAQAAGTSGNDGANSVFKNITAIGGGGGGEGAVGRNGGSGGGGWQTGSTAGGTSTQTTTNDGYTSTGFGNAGGQGGSGSPHQGGGGGGAGAVGVAGQGSGGISSIPTGGNGGVGKAYTIADGSTSVTYAGGGGGGVTTGTDTGQGGSGGGGRAGYGSS